MKTFLLLMALCAFTFAADVEVVQRAKSLNEDGSYKYSYELTDGTAVSEEGLGGVVAQGSAKFVDPEGVPVSFSYVADENGFVATGSHIPVAPPIPDAIVRALEYIRTHPPQGLLL